MTAWLVCERCGTKEAVLPATDFDCGCKECGGRRVSAEDDDGNPIILFSRLSDLIDEEPT